MQIADSDSDRLERCRVLKHTDRLSSLFSLARFRLSFHADGTRATLDGLRSAAAAIVCSRVRPRSCISSSRFALIRFALPSWRMRASIRTASSIFRRYSCRRRRLPSDTTVRVIHLRELPRAVARVCVYVRVYAVHRCIRVSPPRSLPSCSRTKL